MEINIHNQTVFVAPLDWGLGHTTRCVPIITQLLKNNNKVVLGNTKTSEAVFAEEFPQLTRVSLPEYNITYSQTLSLWLSLLFQFPRFKTIIRQENILLNQIIKEHKIDVVISDNRYGLFHPSIRSIILCHQLNLKTPFFQKSLNTYHQHVLKMFTEIWVPDYENKSQSLAGDLSANTTLPNCKYIGSLSRLKKIELPKKYDYLFLLSGPEPKQTQLLNQVIDKIKKSNLNAAIVTSSNMPAQKEGTLFRLPNNLLLSELIAQSETIVCRSGYSTLMDMHFLQKKKLILIPTKGQSEQEYLANYWKVQFNSIVLQEDKIQTYNF